MRNNYKLLMIVIILIVLSPLVFADTYDLELSQTNELGQGGYWGYGATDDSSASGSFTTGDAFLLSRLEIRIQRDYAYNYDCKIDIYAVDANDMPTGSILGSSDSRSCNDISSGSMGFINYTFSSPVSLSATTQYAFVHQPSGWISQGAFQWAWDNAESGQACGRKDASWQVQDSSCQPLFKAFSLATPPPPPNLNISVNSSTPPADYRTDDTTPDFSFIFHSDNLTANCSVRIGAVSYGTNATAKNNTNTTITATTPLAEGSYSWFINCSDDLSSDTSTPRTITIDTTFPEITAQLPANNSVNSAFNNTSFNLTASDTGGFVYYIQSNISYPNGTIALTMNYTDTTDKEEETIKLNQTFKFNFAGLMMWKSRVCDGHTLENIIGIIEDPKINLKNKAIELNEFSITPKDPLNIEKVETQTLTDRITFNWDLKAVEKTEYDLLSSGDQPFRYFPRSKYAGHFIIGEKWIDFEGLENLKITKINDYHYIVETTPSTKIIEARSTGVLNCIDETSYFTLYNTGLFVVAKNFMGNVTLNTFNATITETGETKSTTNGLIEFNLSNGNYSVVVRHENFTTKTENITITSGFYSLYSQMYLLNSIAISVYNEDNGNIIENASVLFNANTTYYQTHTTTNGSMYITNLPTGVYDLEVSSSGYITRHYPVTLTGSNYITQNAYLLNGSNLVKLVIKSEAQDKFIEGASVVLTRNVNGTWSTIETQTTDGVGAVRFGMKEGYEYIIYITATGYGVKVFTLRPYEDSYTIYLTSSSSSSFYDLFNKVSYSVNPNKLVIPPSSLQNAITCFNLTALSSGGYLDYFSINGSLNGSMNVSNITGAPTGSTAQFCLNLTKFSGFNITIDYFIKVSGEDLYSFSRQYFIDNRTEGSLTAWFSVEPWSIVGVLRNYGDDLTTTWKVIIMSIVAIGLMLTFAYWLPPAILGFIGISVIAVMSWVWFPAYTLIVMILILVMAIIYLITNKGGSG